MTPVVIYGPPASGKTQNAEALRDYFGLANILEEWRSETVMRQDTLYLTTADVPSFAKYLPPCLVVHIDEALKLLKA